MTISTKEPVEWTQFKELAGNAAQKLNATLLFFYAGSELQFQFRGAKSLSFEREHARLANRAFMINTDDVEELTERLAGLSDSAKSKPLYLFLHTLGGSIKHASSLIELITDTFKNDIYVVVPCTAKSAGTYVAVCCGNKIIMKDKSLSRVDPRLPLAKSGHISARLVKEVCNEIINEHEVSDLLQRWFKKMCDEIMILKKDCPCFGDSGCTSEGALCALSQGELKKRGQKLSDDIDFQKNNMREKISMLAKHQPGSASKDSPVVLLCNPVHSFDHEATFDLLKCKRHLGVNVVSGIEDNPELYAIIESVHDHLLLTMATLDCVRVIYTPNSAMKQPPRMLEVTTS